MSDTRQYNDNMKDNMPLVGPYMHNTVPICGIEGDEGGNVVVAGTQPQWMPGMDIIT